MLVVLFIIVVITAVALSGQSTYNETLILTDTTYTVAFSVREAQSLGLSSRTTGGIANAGYGVHLDRAFPGQYDLFADINPTAVKPTACITGTPGTPEAKPGNCLYDSGLDTIVQTSTFTRGFTIKKFCGAEKGTALRYCSTDGVPLTTLDVVFLRPNTTTVLSGYRAGSLKEFSCSEITVGAPTGGTEKTVRISNLGEISIGQSCP
jgi:hypothetical protein